MTALVAFALGVVFAAGLVISGMTLPGKVLGFLDVTGAWDPSLAFVMAGAIAVFLPLHRATVRRTRPVLLDRFHPPSRTEIDRRLIGGAAIFGIGWGLAGYCPGPALASLVAGGAPIAVFVVAMAGGIALVRAVTGSPPPS